MTNFASSFFVEAFDAPSIAVRYHEATLRFFETSNVIDVRVSFAGVCSATRSACYERGNALEQ